MVLTPIAPEKINFKISNRKRCKNTLSHVKDGILHENTDRCRYDHTFDNKVYVCTVGVNNLKKDQI